MSPVCFHFLDARGGLSEIRSWLLECLGDTHAKASTIMAMRPVDIVVQAGGDVIPEKGHLGYTPTAGVIYLTLDPASATLRTNANRSLERMFARELHHATRWDGPGYGTTLGEALVSEGLAGHFARQLYGDLPEPWEALPLGLARAHAERAAGQWDDPGYGHDEWFFGEGALPKWLGYSLGYRLVGQFLSEHPGTSAASLVFAEARGFRSALNF